MKFIFVLMTILFLQSKSLSQTRVAGNIEGFSSDKGSCRACIFNNAEAFQGKGKALQCFRLTIVNRKASFLFELSSAGAYAIAVFHDSNDNNRFDKNFLGIPKEGYGASGNKLPFAAAPRFEENKFIVKTNSVSRIIISLRYL